MDTPTYKITVQDTGKVFYCKQDEFILEAMKKTACGPIHIGCFGGGCGICKMRIVSGEVNISKKMSRAHISVQEQQEGFVLLCCTQPRENIVLAGS